MGKHGFRRRQELTTDLAQQDNIGNYLDALRAANDRGEVQCIANVAVTLDGAESVVIGYSHPSQMLGPIDSLIEQLLNMREFLRSDDEETRGMSQ